jgi:hypothetical protein
MIGPHIGVDLIPIVAGSQVLHQRRIIELVYVHHIREALHRVLGKV